MEEEEEEEEELDATRTGTGLTGPWVHAAPHHIADRSSLEKGNV